LPEEKIRTDGRTEYCDDDGPEGRIARQRWNEKAARRFEPGYLHRNCRAEISEQGEGQPFQERYIAGIGDENLQARAKYAEHENIEERRAADQQAQGICHRSEVGADIDCVRYHQKKHDALQDRIRIMLSNIGSYAFSRCPANASAYLLDGGHKWIREQQRPRDGESKLCAGLGICGDATWVVIRGARNKAGTQRTENAAAF